MEVYTDDADAKRRGMPNTNNPQLATVPKTPCLLLPSPV
jgi:hypothetical protein